MAAPRKIVAELVNSSPLLSIHLPKYAKPIVKEANKPGIKL